MKNLSEINPEARVWIYASPRILTSAEIKYLREEGEKFVDEWAAHGKKLEAAFDVLNEIFLVVAADESMMQASGCSIDKSLNFIQTMGKTMGIDFLNRTIVWYREEGVLRSLSLHEFWSHRKAGKISEETLVFNTLIKTAGELKPEFEIPFQRSWHQEMWR